MNRYNFNCYEYILNENVDLIYILARRFTQDAKVYDELINVGFKGLYKAIRQFDMKLNKSFAKFAVKFIIVDMKNKLKSLTIDKISISEKEEHLKIVKK